MTNVAQVSEEFFNELNSGRSKKAKGIEGVTMNAPYIPVSVQGHIGMELEIEASSRTPSGGDLEGVVTKSGQSWRVTTDGSLRGDYAKEYIFSGPVTRSEVPVLINGLFEKFGQLDTHLDNSNRCSTHVHLNFQGTKLNEITSFIILWTVFEEALINWCGDNRKTNHFALSAKQTQATLNAWENFLRYGQFPGGNRDENGLKYSALNVLPLRTIGSLEVRCGAAAEEPLKPIQWATLLDVMREYCLETYKDVRTISYDISERGASQILKALCEKEDVLASMYEQILEANDMSEEKLDRMGLEGFRLCQKLVYEFPWQQWLEEINKPYIPNPFSTSRRRPANPYREDLPPPPVARPELEQEDQRLTADRLQELIEQYPRVAPRRSRAQTTPEYTQINVIRENLGLPRLSANDFVNRCQAEEPLY